jgi:hypothetical protein
LKDVADAPMAIVEMGAGGAVPTVRFFSQQQLNFLNATLIRINPRECDVPGGQIGIAGSALESLQRIDSLI